jgi:hypothetical protein
MYFRCRCPLRFFEPQNSRRGEEVGAMVNVACFCGRSYSFAGQAGACPGCGEIAAIITAAAAARGSEVYRQPLPTRRDSRVSVRPGERHDDLIPVTIAATD